MNWIKDYYKPIKIYIPKSLRKIIKPKKGWKIKGEYLIECKPLYLNFKGQK